MPKRKSKFEPNNEKYPCYKRGRHESEAECIICGHGTFVSVANKGKADLDAHMATEKHRRASRGESTSAKMTDFFSKPGTKIEEEVAVAECTMAFHTVKHHQSYRSTDCTSSLLNTLFHNSETGKKYSCARTKTEAIINNVLAPFSIQSILEDLEEQSIMYLGVATDGSNHKSTKLFPVLIQYFDFKNGGLQSKLIQMKSVANETAQTISTHIRESLQSLNLYEKTVCFTGDNTNTNFGGINHKQGTNIFTFLKEDKPNLVGVGCPAHILNNSIHHAADQMSIDIATIIYKIYNYFSIYTVRTEALKEYCEFVEVEYRKLLSHSKTRWLSLFPGLTRLLQMFPALKSYFSSIDKPPVILKNFFSNELAELYLWHMHSFVSIFHKNIEKMERSKNSIIEITTALQDMESMIVERMEHNFMSIKTKSMLRKLQDDGVDCSIFITDVKKVYLCCHQYLKKWTLSFEEFKCMDWMSLHKEVDFNNLENSLLYLSGKGIDIDDVKLFDQISLLNKFIKDNVSNEDFQHMLSHEKWTKFFLSCKVSDLYSELLPIVQFFYSIMAHNANCERVFSMMNVQWTKERDNLSVDSVQGILMVLYNFSDMTCKQFHTFISKNKSLLKKISSNEKYKYKK